MSIRGATDATDGVFARMDSSLERQFPDCETLNGCCDRFVISDDSMVGAVNAGAGDGGVGLAIGSDLDVKHRLLMDSEVGVPALVYK